MAAVGILALPRAIQAWFEALEPLPLAEAVPVPSRAAVFSADMVVGFCTKGPLASERVGALVEPVAGLFRRSHEHGVRDFVLLQDTHDPSAPEFAAFPPHCVRGTEESETVAALSELPFADEFAVFEKNSLAPGFGTGFDRWLDAHGELRTAIVVGDCTDLCVTHVASHLRQRANAAGVDGFSVVVPANAVDTYDLPEELAGNGAMAHDADFFHRVFLYHLALTGVRVVGALT